MAKKKSYNPFKMWGSWIGAILGIPLNLLFNSGRVGCIKDPLCKIQDPFSTIIFDPTNITWIIGLFLLGWGIHSLIRRLK